MFALSQQPVRNQRRQKTRARFDYAPSRRLAQRADSNVFYTKSWQDWNLVSRAYVYQDLTTPRAVELQRLPELTLQGVRQPFPGLPGVLYEVNAATADDGRAIVRPLGDEPSGTLER